MSEHLDPHAPQVTGVVLSWRREANLPAIVHRLLAQRFMAGVVICDNARTHEAARSYWGDVFRGHLFVRAQGVLENQFTWARALASLEVDTPLVATCDDDWLSDDWARLYELALAHPGQLVHALKHGHHRAESGGRKPWSQLGWGAIYPRERPQAIERYIARWGVDELLRRKADRIWTHLAGPAAACLVARGTELPGARTADALYRRGDHAALTELAAARCRRLLGEISEAQYLAQESSLQVTLQGV